MDHIVYAFSNIGVGSFRDGWTKQMSSYGTKMFRRTKELLEHIPELTLVPQGPLKPIVKAASLMYSLKGMWWIMCLLRDKELNNGFAVPIKLL